MLGFLLLQLASADTLRPHDIPAPPSVESPLGTSQYGTAPLRIRTRQGEASVWLLRSLDTVFIAAMIRDSTPSWSDEFVVSIDTQGDAGPSPGHDDFQWIFRRVLDSTVVYRGRNGRWEPPKGDPDWRMKRERSGGGWELSGRDRRWVWTLLLRLDPAWLEGAAGRLPRIAFRVYDNDPHGWFAWPMPDGIPQAASIEHTPDLWAPVRPDGE